MVLGLLVISTWVQQGLILDACPLGLQDILTAAPTVRSQSRTRRIKGLRPSPWAKMPRKAGLGPPESQLGLGLGVWVDGLVTP